MPEKELLDLRICDLGVNLKTSPVQNRIDQLYEELKSKGIRFRPHCWLSNDWFSPDGVPGIAIPFYLAHPRLARLERKMIHEVEGGTKDWCMRILRHETGHAIDTAYRLRRRRSWREVFGGSSQPYPDHYQPKPYSKNFVLHLDQWYAQSHPTEDFAETFAVWFKQRRRWAKDYHGWPALHKLEYVDEVMEEICRERPLVTTRESIDPIRLLKKTLRRHYNEKRERYGIGYPNSIDGDLRRLFSDAAKHSRRLLAWKFLQRSRAEMSKVAVKWTGQHQYAIDQVLREMIDRCRVLKLRLGRSERETKQDVLVLLTVQTMKYLHRGYPRVML